MELPLSGGEINVQQVVRETAERQRFAARQQRELEWIALKQWWQASRSLKKAEQRGKPEAIQRARRDLVRVVECYGSALARARRKWEEARKELRKRGYQRLD